MRRLCGENLSISAVYESLQPHARCLCVTSAASVWLCTLSTWQNRKLSSQPCQRWRMKLLDSGWAFCPTALGTNRATLRRKATPTHPRPCGP